MENGKQNLAIVDQSGFAAMMERLAVNKDVDVEKLERMMAMNERILDRNAEQAFAADYVRMKPKLPKVVRTKINTQTDSKYAPLEDINTQIDPVLEEYGFGTSTKIVAQTESTVTVQATLWHRDGHKESTNIVMPLDNVGAKGTVNKTNVHATASSVTYAKRVAICALLNISTGDDKDGNTQAVSVSTEQAAEIDTLIRESGADRKKFLAVMLVEDVRDIPARSYQMCVELLKKKKDLKK